MNASAKWASRVVWIALVGVLSIGCSPLQTIAFIFARDDKVPAEYPLRPKEGPKHDKHELITVLVLADKSNGAIFEFAGADRELSSMLAKRLPEEAKTNDEKITVVSPAQVDKFKMANPTWKTMHPTMIGKKLGADYVLDVSMSHMNIYQPGSANQIYEGRAEVAVDVYDVSAGQGEPKHRYVHPYTYPKTGMIAVGDLPVSRFKMLFLERLALELARKHTDYKVSAGIASDQ